MATVSKLSPSDIALALEAEPLVGVTRAAELLGIKAPNFKRDAAPFLTEVKVEGSASAWFRSEVLALSRPGARRAARERVSNGASGD